MERYGFSDIEVEIADGGFLTGDFGRRFDLVITNPFSPAQQL